MLACRLRHAARRASWTQNLQLCTAGVSHPGLRPQRYLSRQAWQSRKAAFLHPRPHPGQGTGSGSLKMCLLPTSPFIPYDKKTPPSHSPGTRDSRGGCRAAVRDRDHAAGCFFSAPSRLAAAALIPWATGVTRCLGRYWCEVLGRARWPPGLPRVRRKKPASHPGSH